MRFYEGPGREISIDLVILSNSSPILTFLDSWSHWPDAYILEDQKADTIAKIVFKYCSQNGFPQLIRSDNGLNLVKEKSCSVS